jgi:hypothetical protein
LHTVIDIYNHIVERRGPLTFVNFHFDREDDNILIVSRREHDARLTVKPRKHMDLMIRIPDFATNVEVDIRGRLPRVGYFGNFAYVPAVSSEGVTVRYDLPVETFAERTNGVDYSFELRGDDVTGIAPHDDFYPFYPPATLPAAR